MLPVQSRKTKAVSSLLKALVSASVFQNQIAIEGNIEFSFFISGFPEKKNIYISLFYWDTIIFTYTW
jgi:hypothetical protein